MSFQYGLIPPGCKVAVVTCNSPLEGMRYLNGILEGYNAKQVAYFFNKEEKTLKAYWEV